MNGLFWVLNQYARGQNKVRRPNGLPVYTTVRSVDCTFYDTFTDRVTVSGSALDGVYCTGLRKESWGWIQKKIDHAMVRWRKTIAMLNRLRRERVLPKYDFQHPMSCSDIFSNPSCSLRAFCSRRPQLMTVGDSNSFHLKTSNLIKVQDLRLHLPLLVFPESNHVSYMPWTQRNQIP